MTPGDPTTDPAAAQAEAERLISEARASGAARLELCNLAALTALPGSLATLADQLTELALIGCDRLIDIEACAALHRLEVLEIHPDFEDKLRRPHSLFLASIQPIGNLASLKTLDLSWCEALTDVSVLQGLTGLQSLSLSGCKVLTDVSGLQGLTGLQSLDLIGCSALTDVSVLQGLTGLQSLDLPWCKALTDVSVLKSLTGLVRVSIFDGPALEADRLFDWLDHAWPHLTDLYANRIAGLPAELESSMWYDNCLPRLRAWREELQRGVAPESHIKLLVLGNGRVGKTQICRRLKGEVFDESVLSTHGIELGEHLINLPGAGAQGSGLVTLKFWDFGGQDIYLGTHALFLDARAIYLIVWSPEFENTDESEQNGIRMANRPLVYWLEYVRSLAGPQATVLVVQTRCDRESDVCNKAPLPADHGFEWLRETACSANDQVRPDGMEGLLVELKRAVRRQIEQHGRIPMPVSWAGMGKTLAGVRDGLEAPPRRTISVDDFNALASAPPHGVIAPSVLLEYLHRSGQVFWNEQAFGGEIVLQLEWALAGIYAVLDRNRLLPLLRKQHGLFSSAALAVAVWQDKSKAEQELLLTMMQKCRIVFEVGADQYIAPGALPEERDIARRIEREWRGATPDAQVTLNYDFLHEGVLREMLCELGSCAGHDAVYWRYGVCFYDTEARSTVCIRSRQPDARGQGGAIEVQAAGGEAGRLVGTIVKSLQGIRIGREPQVHWQTHDGSGVETKGRHENLEPKSAVQGVAPFAVHPGARPLAPNERKPVYVSYAWGGESEALVDQVEQQLAGLGTIEFIRDKRCLRPGDWISSFMQDIGRARRVLVVLSDKYLRSPYCMRELLYLHQASLGERHDMMARVVPLIVSDLQIDRAVQRALYVKHWKTEDAALTAAYDGMDLLSLGSSDRAEWLAIKDFVHRVSDMVAWCADVLMPRGVDGVDAVCRHLDD